MCWCGSVTKVYQPLLCPKLCCWGGDVRKGLQNHHQLQSQDWERRGGGSLVHQSKICTCSVDRLHSCSRCLLPCFAAVLWLPVWHCGRSAQDGLPLWSSWMQKVDQLSKTKTSEKKTQMHSCHTVWMPRSLYRDENFTLLSHYMNEQKAWSLRQVNEIPCWLLRERGMGGGIDNTQGSSRMWLVPYVRGSVLLDVLCLSICIRVLLGIHKAQNPPANDGREHCAVCGLIAY